MRRILALLLFAFACRPETAARAESVAADRGAPRDLHDSAIVLDGHSDLTTALLDEQLDIAGPGARHTDLPRMRRGGVTAETFSIFVDGKYAAGGATKRALALIDVTLEQIARHPKDLVLATRAADVRAAKRDGKIAVLMAVEGGHAIEGSLIVLRTLRRLGVRSMSLTHMMSNDLGDAAGDAPRHRGLSTRGEDVVREMQRIGMLVDVSHASDATIERVLAITRGPVIASHSSARALTPHARNLTDDHVRRIAATGGVVMINFYPGYLRRGERPVDVSTLVDHIEHVARIAGASHVGLGSDFDGVRWLPDGITGPESLPKITAELVRRGFSDEDVRAILGESFLRAMELAER